MKFRVLSLLARPVLVRSADNASDLAAHDRSGRVSRPFPASCSPSIATPRFGGALAYALRPERASRRTLDMTSAHSDGVYRSASGSRPDQSAPAFSADTQRPCVGSWRRTWSDFRVRSLSRNRANSANGSHGRRGAAARISIRTAGSADQSGQSSSGAANGTSTCKRLSTTSQWPGQAETDCRKSRSVLALFPYRKLAQGAEAR